MSARCWAVIAPQALDAARARATIEGISAMGVRGTEPTTSPVAGLIESRVAIVAVFVMGYGTPPIQAAHEVSGLFGCGRVGKKSVRSPLTASAARQSRRAEETFG